MEIEGYENYLIHIDGRVWSKKCKGRFLKPRVAPNGYLRVNLYKDGKCKTNNIHRLLGNAFIPNPENKPEIDHIDNNRQNNNISNLRWVTISENNYNRKAYGAVPFRCVNKVGNRFRTRIIIDGKRKHLGTYDTVEEASEARIKYCTENNIML